MSMPSTIAAICWPRLIGTATRWPAYDALLASRPGHVAALNRRGNALAALDRSAEALAAYDAALAIEPANAEVHSNRSVTLVALDRLDEALQSCETALASRPDHANALYNRGNVLRALDRYEEAAASYVAALAIEPRRADALNNLGLALVALERHAEALSKFDAALAIDPNDIGALHNRANALAELGSFEEALTPCDIVLTKNPLHADALNTRGVVLAKLRPLSPRHWRATTRRWRLRPTVSISKSIAAPRCSSSIASTRRWPATTKRSADDPGNVVALINRGNACIKNKRFAEALRSYDSALAVDPGQASALRDRCVVLAEMDQFDEALASVDQALRIDPHIVAAHVNRGNALLKLARMEEALASYNEALRLDPEQVDANFNASLTRMCLGDFGGWKQYEYRWKKKEFGSQRREYPQPIWSGEQDVNGKTILLVHEQGFGDTIQFIRYAPLVAERGASVLLGVQPALKSVALTVPGVKQVLGDGEVLPDFDLYCPLLSLPVAFGTVLETIPAKIPYIRPYQERLAKWRGRLPDNGRLRVGICWAGNSAHRNDRKRSIPLDRLAAVLSLPNVDFFSLQKDVSEAQSAILLEHGVVALGQDFSDFADTAAVVALLDLIIAVDTSVAHLAGAMGKGVALLIPFSPDFRWLLDRADSPWYPTMRMFRQSIIGDWDAPVAKLRDELAAVAARPRLQTTVRG